MKQPTIVQTDLVNAEQLPRWSCRKCGQEFFMPLFSGVNFCPYCGVRAQREVRPQGKWRALFWRLVKRLRRARSKWLSYVVPLGAALALAAIAVAILTAVVVGSLLATGR